MSLSATVFPPGSTLWMIRHEVRLNWRFYAKQWGGKVGMIVSLCILGGIFIIGGGLLGAATRALTPERIVKVMPMLTLVADGMLAFVFSLMLAQSMAAATTVFYDRGDLDLLLSSPVKPQRVLTVRMLGMAFNCSWGFCALVTPFLIMAATLGGHPGWLAAYPILISLALLTTAVGVLAAMALFKVIGPRRTRTVAQILGAAIGATVFLSSQMPALLGKTQSRDVMGTLRRLTSMEDYGPWISWPAHALLGEPLPLLSIVVPSALLFLVITWTLGRRFADNAAAAAGAPEQVRVRKGAATPQQFRSGLNRIMVAKEMKLIFRDPGLLSQVLLQILYLVPASVLIIRGVSRANGDGLMSAMALGSGASIIAFMAGQLAAGFGWLTISAEEAPELLICAPVTQWEVGKAKVAAVMIPTLALVTIPVLILSWFSVWAGLCALAGALASSCCIAFMELWTQKPAKRSDFRMRRKGTGSGWTYFLEFLISAFIGTAAFLMAAGGFWVFGAVVPVGIVGLVMAIVKKDKWLNG